MVCLAIFDVPLFLGTSKTIKVNEVPIKVPKMIG
ncbi:hypothetical protein VCHC17A1_3938, partial [Vibrio cholerae HC-17A1]